MIQLVALAAASASTAIPALDGARLHPGRACYAIVADGRPVGATLQTIEASRFGRWRTWEVVVHQRLAGGRFDMRDHFVLDRRTLLPIAMDSERGRDRSERGWHRVSLQYTPTRILGSKETASGVEPLDVSLSAATWDGNLWGVTFAALPLAPGASYAIPFWQYDKGFGTFAVRVVGTETVETPDGRIDAWSVEAGPDPTSLARYSIAKDDRRELGYATPSGGQRLGGNCEDIVSEERERRRR